MAQTVDALAVDLAEVAARLQAASASGLRRELYKAIKASGEKIPPKVREELKPHLPDGYAAVLDADLKMGVSVRAGADPVVAVWAESRTGRSRALRRLDSGTLGHPVFGMRSKANPRRWAAWVFQEDGVRPGFFTGPAEGIQPEARREIQDALERVKDMIWKGL